MRWTALSDLRNYSELAAETPVYRSALGSALRIDEAAEVPSYVQEAAKQGLMPNPVSLLQGVAMTGWP